MELFAVHALRPLENRALDAFVKRQAAALAPDPDLVLVYIDEKSLARMESIAGRWPWSRAVHAELIEGLAEQKPRAIVFDIMFTEADGFRPKDDAVFAETVAQHPNTYFPLMRLPEDADPKGPRLAELGATSIHTGVPSSRPSDRASARVRVTVVTS